jgi:hypothetical protein
MSVVNVSPGRPRHPGVDPSTCTQVPLASPGTQAPRRGADAQDLQLPSLMQELAHPLWMLVFAMAVFFALVAVYVALQ